MANSKLSQLIGRHKILMMVDKCCIQTQSFLPATSITVSWLSSVWTVNVRYILDLVYSLRLSKSLRNKNLWHCHRWHCTHIYCLLHSPNIVDKKRVVCFAVVRSVGQVFKVAPYGEPGSTTGVERPPLWRHMATPVV